MSAPWSIPYITAGPQVRGPQGEPTEVRFAVQSATVTWAWGTQPGEGAVVYVETLPGAAGTILPGQAITFELYGRRWFGVCVSNQRIAASNGRAYSLRYSDQRIFLDWDVVFGSWNNVESRIVDGVRRRRWWRIRPQDYASNRRTYSNRPLLAWEILDEVFGASTVETRWIRDYAGVLNVPVMGVDAMAGRKLADIVGQISETTGCVFTLDGDRSLRWAMRGVGSPVVVPGNSDDIGEGLALANSASRIFIVGDRNLHQVFNIGMVPDWNPDWNRYWGLGDEVTKLAKLVYYWADVPGHPPGTKYASLPLRPDEPDRWHAWSLALARAYQITVGEVAALVPELRLADHRLFTGRSRMEMPAVLYLRLIVYRAFRLPPTVAGRPRTDFTIAAEGPAQVEYDPVTGLMSPKIEAGVGGGPGMVLVQNHAFGPDLFRQLRPEALDLARLEEAAGLWSPAAYRPDDNGEEGGQVVLLDQPAVAVRGALKRVDGYTVFDAAAATLETVEVRATLALEAERFTARIGTGTRDESLPASGLRAEYVHLPPSPPFELPYADGMSAMAKAVQLAGPLLDRPSLLEDGSFTVKMRPGDTIAALSGIVSRITARWSDQGHAVDVHLARERPRGVYLPEQDLDRLYRLQGLFPGQDELRLEASSKAAEAKVLAQAPGFRRDWSAAFAEAVRDRGAVEYVWVGGASGTLPVGTPLWKEPGVVVGSTMTHRQVSPPSATGSTHEEFAGVTLRDNEAEDLPIAVQAFGNVLVRVQGPVAVNEALTRANGVTALSRHTGTGPVIGLAQQAVANGQTRLVLVRLGSSGGAGSAPRQARWA